VRLKDPRIGFRPALSARAVQAVFPLIDRVRYSSPRLQFATKVIGRPREVTVPTRHGGVRALVYCPAAGDITAQLAASHKPPVHLITHGGAFFIRTPGQHVRR